MAKIFKLKAANGETILPLTIMDAVINTSGKTLPDVLSEISSIFNLSTKEIVEDGLYFVDANGNIQSCINLDGMDTAEIGSSLKYLIESIIDAYITPLNYQIKEITENINRLSNNQVNINKIIELKNWSFHLISNNSDINYKSTEEAEIDFDDSSWDNINIPHDWSIYNDFNQTSLSTFNGGFLDGGDAWYRRSISNEEALLLKNKLTYIYFDGVYMESDLYVNGNKVGINKNGYNSFFFDISSFLKMDGTDIIALFVRNRQPNSRWYSGSGIYRNAYLITASKIKVGIYDMFITTPNLSDEYYLGFCNTNIKIKINNTLSIPLDATISHKIKYKNNIVEWKTFNIRLSPGNNDITNVIKVKNPILWDIYAGNLYTVESEVRINDKSYVSRETTFGYRWFIFNPNTGFWINDKNIKIQGVCLHHDLGCLGAEVNRSAIERQIRIMKEMGCNAIRTSHNQQSSIFLDVCQKEGILVMEEALDCWKASKNSYDFARYFQDYGQVVIESMVNRDKNNPAVIIWSIGNEIHDTRTTDYDAQITANNLRNYIRAIDTTRPVTFSDDQKTNDISLAVDELMDIKGFNYADYFMGGLHTNHPTWCLFGSETTSALSSRGIYSRDNVNLQCSSFDDDVVSWGLPASVSLDIYKKSAYLAGHFVWTGFDYIGEPTPFNNSWPAKSSYFGICDTCGFPKDIYYMYQSQWQDKPMIHILPHWNYTLGDIKKIWIYSNCSSIELFLNDVSLGLKSKLNIGNRLQFEWSDIQWVSGTLLAKGYDNNGNVIATDVRITAGEASGIKLSSDKLGIKYDSDDLAFITCDIIDASGNSCPLADNLVTFNVAGGTIKGVDNGNAASVERFKGVNYRKAFNGKCLCVIESDGTEDDIVITATADGLSNCSISIPKFTSTILK